MNQNPNKIDWPKHPDVAKEETFKALVRVALSALVIFILGVCVGAFAQYARSCEIGA